MRSFLAKHEPSNDGTLEAFAIGVRTWSIGHAFKVLPTAPPGDAGEGKYPRAAWREALKHACLRIRTLCAAFAYPAGSFAWRLKQGA
jgi:hypothetical protein